MRRSIRDNRCHHRTVYTCRSQANLIHVAQCDMQCVLGLRHVLGIVKRSRPEDLKDRPKECACVTDPVNNTASALPAPPTRS